MADNQETPDRPDLASDLAPDLAKGIAEAEFADGGMLVGHVEGKAVLMVRRGEDIFAIGAECSHYNGPLAEGLVVGAPVTAGPLHPHQRFYPCGADRDSGEGDVLRCLKPYMRMLSGNILRIR